MDDKTTLREWFRDFTDKTGETPTKIVLAADGGWRTEDVAVAPLAFEDVPDEVLDRVFDSGYGGNGSPNLCAWSKSWVLFSDDYDGAEKLCWVPRNPTTHAPIRPGG